MSWASPKFFFIMCSFKIIILTLFDSKDLSTDVNTPYGHDKLHFQYTLILDSVMICSFVTVRQLILCMLEEFTLFCIILCFTHPVLILHTTLSQTLPYIYIYIYIIYSFFPTTLQKNSTTRVCN